MRSIIKFLNGKRTYICAALLFVVGGLEAVELIPQEVAVPLKTFLAAAGLAALRKAL